MQTKYIPLEILNINGIRRYEQRKDDILEYYFKNYSYFQNARTKIFPKLKEAVIAHREPYEFKGWHRAIAYRHAHNPLSARGSILNDPGGRFNIGDINPFRFPKFPALYIADSYEVALRERNQMPSLEDKDGLSANELALCTNESSTDVLIDGHIKFALDLNKREVLNEFYDLIAGIKLPKNLLDEAKKLKINPALPVKSLSELRETILDDNWRALPMQVDLPSNSQIFGQILRESNFEAVIYPSRMRSNGKCAAIFIENFENSDSRVHLADIGPENIETTCLDNNSWRKLL